MKKPPSCDKGLGSPCSITDHRASPTGSVGVASGRHGALCRDGKNREQGKTHILGSDRGSHFILEFRHKGTGAKGLIKMYVKKVFTAMLLLLGKNLGNTLHLQQQENN